MSYKNGWAVPDRSKCEHSGSHLTVSQYLPQWLDRWIWHLPVIRCA